MVLEDDGTFGRVGRLVIADLLVFHGADELFAVMQEDAVVDDGHVGLLGQLFSIDSRASSSIIPRTRY